MKLLFFLIFVIKTAHNRHVASNDGFAFQLIHINDIHAHFEQVNEFTGRCRDPAQCYGGAARIKTAADRIRNDKPDMPSIFLNAGDYYQVITLSRPSIMIARASDTTT